MAPSQMLPSDHEPLNFSPRTIARLEEEDENTDWQRTLRPVAPDSRSVAHSRESSLEKLQWSASSTVRAHAPQRLVDSKPSSYGHHRQTSIVHGIGIQHSRNGSLASNHSSPLSPQMIAAAGAGISPDRADLHGFSRKDNDGSSIGSRPQTALSGTTAASVPVIPERTSSVAAMNDPVGGQAGTHRKPERMASGRSRRDHPHHHSHSSRHKDDPKTVGDYALHVLFTSFIAQAEEKLTEITSIPLHEPEPHVEQICGPGIDAAFDQSIVALGHIAKAKPKPLIDSMMLWRKSKSDAANEARDARAQLHNARSHLPGGALQRRNTEPVQATGPGSNGQPEVQHAGQADIAQTVAVAERRSTVSIYILCRVLLEVFTQSTLASITPEMEDKLEKIIFQQLKSTEPDSLLISPLKLANWNLFAQLLGAMSEISFTSVADRFINDLERSMQELGTKIPTGGRDVESRIELILIGMKHLRIRLSPPDAWERSCNFLISLGKLFNVSHGQKVKAAFCQVLEMLVLPIAATASSSDLAYPRWKEVVTTITPKLAHMFMRPRHWTYSFALTATMLCADVPENFGSQWMQLIYPLNSKLQDRMTRPVCLQAISRLLWTYLYRTNDSVANSTRKLDEVVKIALPNTKRAFSAADLAVTEPLVQIIRFIGYMYPEYCFRNIIFPLVNADQFASNKDLKIEFLDPDRMVVGIHAFLAVMADLEKGEQGKPPFPLDYTYSASLMDRVSIFSVLASPHSSLAATPAQGVDEARLSKPVQISVLSDTVKDYYSRFCEILGKIAIICDNTFGGQAVLDEKFKDEKFNSPGPKTPMTDTFKFSRRDDQQSAYEQKQAFYELFHVAVEALPRCLSADIPFNTLINLLCTGTAHVQSNIARSSAQSLKAIARQSHAQQVTMGFARFIFNFDDRYSTMSDGGMLGPGHIEKTLMLYVELLHIWIDEIRQKTKEAEAESDEPGGTDKRGIKLDLSGIWAEVDQVEAHGLFFLCSQSRRVRYYAVTVLRLITEFDAALRKTSNHEEEKTTRLIDILENDSMQVMSFKDDHLSVAERSRLERGMQNSNSQGALLELCTSDVSYDTTLWFKIFPNFVRIAYDKCPFTVTIGRDLVCNRILQLYQAIVVISEPSGRMYYGSDGSNSRVARTPTTQPEVLVEQFKLYLVFACTTLADPGSAQSASTQNGQHGRKGSKASSTVDKIVTARTLFKYLNPLLGASLGSVRDAAVTAMGSINIHIYRTLLEELSGHVSRCNDEARARIQPHQRTNSNPRRNRKMDLVRTEITHVYKLTAHFLKLPEVYNDEWILNNLVTYAKDLKLFLMDVEVQMDWEFQRLRRHYCGLMEELFEGINRTKDPSRWMTFESRKSAFTLMEDWCGFSPNQEQISQREATMRQSLINEQGAGERGKVSAAMEIEKRNLRTAALSAMASLCGGPVRVLTESGSFLYFDARRMLNWIDAIFNAESNRINLIGRRALKNLIVHNQQYPALLDHCILKCYTTEAPKVLASYFTVVVEVLSEHVNYPCPFWKLLGLCLFTLGNDQSDIRSKSAQVLRTVEERQQPARNSKIQDFDISISDKTKAVYKLAQFEISKRLAKQHTELAFYIFSEFTYYFKEVGSVAQRNVVAIILPWIQSIELTVDPNGGPTAQSYVLLANLLEITIKSSAALHNEVQALWQALATGPHPGNVRLILDFIMSLCLERREQNFVEYAKQIVVFLASTSSAPGNKVIEFLLMQITPKSMVTNDKREAVPPPPDINTLPYCADLSEVLPIGTKQAGFSLGQLSLILLVDLMVAPVCIVPDNVPVLLQVVTVLWDHYTALVQEQAREMLVHLIHELVISRLDDDAPQSTRESIESLIDAIRRHDRSVVWGYEDSNGNVGAHDNKVPPSMEYLTAEVVKTFEITFPGIKEKWGRLSLTWATSCPVRHLACRSFQIFRCILTSLDHDMLGDMIARLCSTISDEDTELQKFSMEVLTTLKTLVAKLDADKLLTFPQLFWTTCACLESINECEFLEAVEMLNEFLDKLDFHSPTVRRMLLDGQPSKWDGSFEGLQPLLYKGLRSSTCLDLTLTTLDKLILLPSDPLIGDGGRFFFTILANFPRLLHAMEEESPDPAVAPTVETLLHIADIQGLRSIAVALDDYLGHRYASAKDFVVQLYAALREYYLPDLEFQMLTMLMGLLTNATAWVKIHTMRILRVIVTEVDMKKPEIASHGSDMISPLLRLLQTEYCMEALEVLDNIMSMSGSSMDKHHLRMSMTRLTSKAVRKEYERAQSLFGIPEASGWAIPMPARKTESTRANTHAVFYMCQMNSQNMEGGMPESDIPTPAEMEFEFEFHDEYAYGYLHVSDRADTMMSDDARGLEHAPMGDLISKLDSLDDFFDDMSSTGPPSEGRSSRTITEFSPDSFDSGAQLYDEQILPILHQASANNNNNNITAAFQSGFADRPSLFSGGGPGPAVVAGSTTSSPISPSMMHPATFGSISSIVGGGDPGGGPGGVVITSPTASITSTSTSTSQLRPFLMTNIRPGLNARSITSPSAPASYLANIGDFTSDDDGGGMAEYPEDIGVFSDNDEDQYQYPQRPSTATSTGTVSGVPQFHHPNYHISSSTSGSGAAHGTYYSGGGGGGGGGVSGSHSASPSVSVGHGPGPAVPLHPTLTSPSLTSSVSASATDGSSSKLENMIRPFAQSTRSRMRRLTGGGSSRSREERLAAVAAATGPLSPQVPKVPNAFLPLGHHSHNHQGQQQPQSGSSAGSGSSSQTHGQGHGSQGQGQGQQGHNQSRAQTPVLAGEIQMM